MSIDSLMSAQGASIYYDLSFRNVLEDHLTYLKNLESTTVLAIEPIIAYKYKFDLYSLLFHYNIPMHLHWLVMRLNDFLSPTEATSELTSLLIPNSSVIEQIRQSHLSTRRVS